MIDMTLEQLLKIAPFNQEIPSNPLARTRAFVREIALGAVYDYWAHDFHVFLDVTEGVTGWHNWSGGYTDLVTEYTEVKWLKQMPFPSLLATLGYTEWHPQTRFEGRVELQRAAYDLIEAAATLPVFISYRNTDSSAFALLLLARMKALGLEPFLDVAGLRGGDDWDAKLRASIATSDYVVSLLGQTTLESDYVCTEIKIAADQNKRIIPVFHNGFTDAHLRDLKSSSDMDIADVATILETRQGITIAQERARDYNAAVIDILNVLGIAP